MKITKRQLKRIIREEYSRLKRRGLIREMGEMEHEQDEFLEEQIGQYEQEIMQAIVGCAMEGYMEQESNPDSSSPQSMLANACMFYGGGDDEILNIAMGCAPVSRLISNMKEEQKRMFGMNARDTEIFALIVDMGIVEEACMQFQMEVGG